MESVGVRELRQRASELLRQVEGGQSMVITDRGRPVAVLSPMPDGDELERLRAAGQVRAATRDLFDLPEPLAAEPGIGHRVGGAGSPASRREMTGQRVTYLDSSAIVKLVRAERESSALRAYLRRRRSTLVSSALAQTEVVRAVLPFGDSSVSRAEDVLLTIELLRVSDRVLRHAAQVRPPPVRSLDAIHLATAQQLGALTAVVTYDGRMAAAASASGLVVAAPA